jgi:hypothetical protein
MAVFFLDTSATCKLVGLSVPSSFYGLSATAAAVLGKTISSRVLHVLVAATTTTTRSNKTFSPSADTGNKEKFKLSFSLYIAPVFGAVEAILI